MDLMKLPKKRLVDHIKDQDIIISTQCKIIKTQRNGLKDFYKISMGMLRDWKKSNKIFEVGCWLLYIWGILLGLYLGVNLG